MVDGWFFILFGVLIALVTAVAACGRVGRNPVLGIRFEPLMRSPWHWREGHRAAGQVIYPTAAVLVVYGLCLVLVWPGWLVRVNLDVLRALGVVGLLGGLGWGVLRGVGAVMHGPPDTPDDGAPPPRGDSGHAAG